MTTIHRSHDMTDKLRDAAQAVLDRWDSLDWKAAPTADYMNRLRAALAAAPQPAPEQGMTRAQVGAMLDAKRLDREALVQVIVQAMLGRVVGLHMAEAIADALLARGLRLPGNGARNRVQYDGDGLDEVVTDAGMHLERMSDNGWFLSGQRSDGSEIAIWIRGKVTLVEERPASRVVEGGDDE